MTDISNNLSSLAVNEMAQDLTNLTDTSNITEGFDVPFYRHSMAITICVCLAYTFVFVLGLVGNCLVVAVICRAPRMRTVTNYFILNLAVADILVILFCLPATLSANIIFPWVLGAVMCKLVPYIQGVSVVASVDSLIAISMDRVFAICFPMRFQITGRRARIIILFIWLIALTSTIPWLLYFEVVNPIQEYPDLQFCQEKWPGGEVYQTAYFIVANVIFCYLLPLLLIFICYIMIWMKVSNRSIPTENKDAQLERMQQRSKIKTIKMLVAVVVIFALSWLPLYAIFIRIKLGSKEFKSWEDNLLIFSTPLAQWLGLANSAVNPICYAFFNQKFRRAFKTIIQSRSCCGTIRSDEYGTSGAMASGRNVSVIMRKKNSVISKKQSSDTPVINVITAADEIIPADTGAFVCQRTNTSLGINKPSVVKLEKITDSESVDEM